MSVNFNYYISECINIGNLFMLSKSPIWRYFKSKFITPVWRIISRKKLSCSTINEGLNIFLNFLSILSFRSKTKSYYLFKHNFFYKNILYRVFKYILRTLGLFAIKKHSQGLRVFFCYITCKLLYLTFCNVLLRLLFL